MLMLGDKQEAHGDHIVQAGRDVSINVADRRSLREHFSERLSAVDSRLNELIPAGLRSPTAENKLQRFSSEQLIISMARSGIPIQVGLDVAERLESHLSLTIQPGSEVTTAHVRRAVTDALYSLGSVYSPGDVQAWADIYARRYGNPTERLKVLHRDGTEEDLNFAFLLKTLIPHLVERILVGTNYEALQEAEVISKTSARRMAEDVLDHVKSMNVYALRYKTLFNLAYDLAVQPPHPWFVDTNTRAQTVIYDLDRASYHDAQLDTLLAAAEHMQCRHSVREAIHHSCSAILAHYGGFLGASQIGALGQLTHALQSADDDGNEPLWKGSTIRQIEGDLRALGSSREQLLRDLARLRNNTAAGDDVLSTVVPHVHRLLVVARALAAPGSNPALVLGQLVAQRSRDLVQLHGAVLEAFRRIEGFRVSQESMGGGTWLVHSVDEVLFRFLQPRVFLLSICAAGNAVATDELRVAVERAAAAIAGDALCNCAVLVVHPSCSGEGRAFVRSCSSKTAVLFVLDSDVLVDVVQSPTRLRRLTEVFIQAAV